MPHGDKSVPSFLAALCAHIDPISDIMVPENNVAHEAADDSKPGGVGWTKARGHLKNKNVINLNDNPNKMPEGKRSWQADVTLHSSK